MKYSEKISRPGDLNVSILLQIFHKVMAVFYLPLENVDFLKKYECYGVNANIFRKLIYQAHHQISIHVILFGGWKNERACLETDVIRFCTNFSDTFPAKKFDFLSKPFT
jgi:hypothetical protein